MNLFFNNMATAAQQVAILYIIVAIGFAADKLNIFTQETAKKVNNLQFKIVTPFVIINSFLSMDYSPEKAKGLGIAILCAFLIHLVSIILATPFFNKADSSEKPVYKFAAIYGNMGYMALPLANAVLGAEGVFYCSAGVIAHNVLAFTHGIWLMTKDGKGRKFDAKTLVLNPGVISVAIGLPLFLFSVKLPVIIQTPVDYIASLNTPVAMLVLGAYIANTELKNILFIKEQYLASFIKQIATPVIMLVIFRLFNFPTVLATACTISAAAPSANNTVVFSAIYDKDTGKASKTVAFSSMASILTMPVMIATAQMM